MSMYVCVHALSKLLTLCMWRSKTPQTAAEGERKPLITHTYTRSFDHFQMSALKAKYIYIFINCLSAFFVQHWACPMVFLINVKMCVRVCVLIQWAINQIPNYLLHILFITDMTAVWLQWTYIHGQTIPNKYSMLFLQWSGALSICFQGKCPFRNIRNAPIRHTRCL